MRTIVLGAGVTGIAAGRASDGVVYESCDRPGGLCASYYLSPGYRFEIGGGHWIFGGDPSIRRLMRAATPMKTYRRRSAVYFSKQQRYVPYPLQNNLGHLEPAIAQQAAAEMAAAAAREPGRPAGSMKAWLTERFGPTLCDHFFYRFHELYTAGLYDRIAAQDDYKSPQRRGRGYNETFVYPIGGLDSLARRLAEPCVVAYGKRAVGIDIPRREVTFADGSGATYDALISTLPLNRTLELAGLDVAAEPDPYTSVLVLNIGATRGPAYPDHHWLYVADADSGFHRIGFYSNVDRSFVPAARSNGTPRESMYVERAYAGGVKPDAALIARYADDVIGELRRWAFIDAVEVLDASWIDVAYTWSWPGSVWRREALRALDDNRIHAAGRYGRWIFQGIADSIRDGLSSGARLRSG
jgi:protoporphyrinogen oxidase